MHRKNVYEKFLKRPLDFLFSLVALIVVSPLLIFLSIMVGIKLGLPIIFRQERPGKNDKPFYLYKFRTMDNRRDKLGNLLPDQQRLTKFGKLLRSTSLDELPELINILKGDLSIVGPRPLLMEYLPLYNENQKKRHEVRPGLTGLAQVNGRNAITWEKKFDYDLQYVNNITLIGDIKIILITILKVLFREGISSNTSETMEEFRGNTK